MKDQNLELVIEVTEAVLRMRAELAAAEERLRQLFLRNQGREVPKEEESEEGTVVERVHRLLARKGPLTAGELITAIGEDRKFAVRSALNKGRTRGDLSFRDGRYHLEKKNPGKGVPPGVS